MYWYRYDSCAHEVFSHTGIYTGDAHFPVAVITRNFVGLEEMYFSLENYVRPISPGV